MGLNTATNTTTKLDGLGMEKQNIDNTKTRQPKERLPELLISHVIQNGQISQSNEQNKAKFNFWSSWTGDKNTIH